MRRLLALLLLVGLLCGAAWADKKKPNNTSLAGLIYTTATSNHPSDTGYDAVEGVDLVLEGTDYKTTTDKKGMFEFKNVPDGDYRLIASKNGFATVQKAVHVENGTFPTTTQLVMNPSGATMVGDTPVGQGTVYVAFAARTASQARNDGSGIPLATQQIVRGAIAAGADPMSLSGNAPVPMQTPGNDWNPTSSDPDSIMMYPPSSPTRTGFQKIPTSPYWLVFNKPGTVLYVSNNAQQIMVLDAAHNNTLMRALPAQGFVTDLQRSPDGRYILAGVMSANPGVMLIDTKTQDPFGYLTLPPMSTHEPGQPRAVAMSPDGSRVFVAMGTGYSGEVVALDPQSGQAVGNPVPVGPNPTGMALSPNGKVLYVANSGSANLSVIDAVTMLEVSRIQVGVSPQKVAVAPDNSRVFVTCKQANSVYVIDPKSLGVVASTPVQGGPLGIACALDAAKVFVTCKDAGTVVMLDGKTGGVIHTTIPMPNSSPFGVAVKP